MNRAKAFKRPPPADWQPAAGETVYVPPVRRSLARTIGTGVICGPPCLDGSFKVRVAHHGKVSYLHMMRDQLRPFKPRQA